MKKFGGYILLFVIGLFFSISGVGAKAKATLEIIAPDSVEVGDTVKVDIKIKDIDGEKVAAAGARLVYDSNLEYIKYEAATKPYNFSINEKILKFAGISFDGQYIVEDQIIMSFEFKANEEKTIKFSLTDVEVVDSLAEYFDTEVIEKEVKVIKKEVKEEIKETVEVEVVEEKPISKLALWSNYLKTRVIENNTYADNFIVKIIKFLFTKAIYNI